MKKKRKRNLFEKNSLIFYIVIFLLTMFLGIGYAQISDIDLIVSGTATASPTKDVIITNIEYVSGNIVDSTNQNIDDPYLTLMKSKIELGNDSTSSITYKIKVKNNGDNIATYDKPIFSEELGYDNFDIEFDIEGINHGDELQSKEEKEFFITFRYKDGLSNISNNVLNSIINFRFLSEKLYYHSDQLVFDGTNYIDTEIKLFSEENIHKNFEISFDIININGTQTSQATIINAMLEKSPYPGFVFRFQTNGTHLEFNSPNQSVKNLTETENDIVDLYAIWYPLEYFYEGEYEFSGSNYINTGIYLFSSQTIDKDFDVSFEIVNRVSTGGQATMMSAMDESGSPWPGIVYRIKSNTIDQVAANANNTYKIEKDYNRNNINKVLLKRRNKILYINFNDEEDEQLLDMTSLTQPFDIPLTFGCSLNASGKPQRYFKGTLKNMTIRIYN